GYGFRGAGDHGGFLQTFQVLSAKPDTAKSALEITLDGKTRSFHFGDFVLTNSITSGEVQGQIVFVGAGISAPSLQHDDYAGLDVKGKIVLLVGNTPPGVNGSRLPESERGAEAARAHGAVGVLQIPSQRILEFMKNRGFTDRAASRETVRLARDADGKLPVMTLGPALSEELLAAFGLDLKGAYEAVTRKQASSPRKPAVAAHMTV